MYLENNIYMVHKDYTLEHNILHFANFKEHVTRQIMQINLALTNNKKPFMFLMYKCRNISHNESPQMHEIASRTDVPKYVNLIDI